MRRIVVWVSLAVLLTATALRADPTHYSVGVVAPSQATALTTNLTVPEGQTERTLDMVLGTPYAPPTPPVP